MRLRMRLLSMPALLFFLALHGAAEAKGPVEPLPAVRRADSVSQLMIRLRDPASHARELAAAEVALLNAVPGVRVSYFRRMSGGAHVLRLQRRMTVAEAREVAARLAALPYVEIAEPDRKVYPAAVPNDPRFDEQWHFMGPAQSVLGGANLQGAWDLVTGSSGVVVAVLDTGLLPHADLDGNITDSNGRVAPGYDFISGTCAANDGGGRDSDPTDPGDFTTGSDCSGEDAAPSSWHGTHVAGTIGALTDNGVGVAGINWAAKVQPLRVLGRGGGFTSDITDAIRWAVGISVSGVPDNTTPAKVLNLSFGGPGSCGTLEQEAIDDAVGAGAVVVVAAGNESADLDETDVAPANCDDVITVAATDINGQFAVYSNLGATVEISAPGGDMSVDPGVLSTHNAGTTTATVDTVFNFLQGTSMAAPHVSGVVSLLFSIDPTLTPINVLQILQLSARPFPTGPFAGFDCDTDRCGAGLLDAAEAVALIGDADPDPFSFTDLTDQPRSTLVTSNSRTITGIDVRAPVTVSGGQYSIDGGSFTSALGGISTGQSIRVRHTTSSNHSTTVNTILTIGDVSDTFSSTTLPDSTPDKFRFKDRSGVARDAPMVSNAVTIKGIAVAAPISVTGGEYSIGCNGSFTSAADVIGNGQTVCVRHQSASGLSTRTDTTLTVGGASGTVSDTFSTTTESRLLVRLRALFARFLP